MYKFLYSVLFLLVIPFSRVSFSQVQGIESSIKTKVNFVHSACEAFKDNPMSFSYDISSETSARCFKKGLKGIEYGLDDLSLILFTCETAGNKQKRISCYNKAQDVFDNELIESIVDYCNLNYTQRCYFDEMTKFIADDSLIFTSKDFFIFYTDRLVR